MTGPPARVLLFFLDGVGIGENDARTNPLVRANLPVLRSLLGGRLPVRDRADPVPAHPAPATSIVAADATLGVPGLPQSGTGQTALLTGRNGPEIFGRHFGPWVPTPLRPLLAAENLLSRARRAGRAIAFANAHPRKSAEARPRRPAAPSLAARAAGVLGRHEEALRRGDAVAASLTNDAWRMHVDPGAPLITPALAGENLARICREADLTLFAHYDTDLAGHRRDLGEAVAVLERVDSFLGGLIGSLPGDTLVVMASDHGNIEDVTVGHTLNSVPVVATGPGSAAVARRVHAITDVAPVILELLGISEP